MDLTRRWPAGLARRARRLGPLPWSAAGPGPAVTRPPAERLAPVVLDVVDGIWNELGQPDPLTVVEVGAGEGELARELLRLGPRCLTALRYVLVEADRAPRERQTGLVAIESPALVLGPVGRDEDLDGGDGNPAVVGLGPMLTSLGELPHVDGPAIVLAIGFVSALPSDRLEWRAGRWHEVRLAATDPGRGDDLDEVTVPLDRPRAAAAEQLVGPAPRPDPARFAVHTGATDWLSRAVRSAEWGRLVVADRWTGATFPLPEGETVPLALDQLSVVRAPLDPEPTPLGAAGPTSGPAEPTDRPPSLDVVCWRLERS